MPVLRTRLAGEEHQFLGADAACVHVNQEFEPCVRKVGKAEVGHFYPFFLLRRQGDPCLAEILERLLLCPFEFLLAEHLGLLPDPFVEKSQNPQASPRFLHILTSRR